MFNKVTKKIFLIELAILLIGIPIVFVIAMGIGTAYYKKEYTERYHEKILDAPQSMRTIRYYDDVGENSNLMYFRFNQGETYPLETVRMKPLNKEGFSFVGFFDQPNAMGTQYTDKKGNFLVNVQSNSGLILYPAFEVTEDGE